MSKKKKILPKCDLPSYPLGASIILVNCHLWTGAVGTVETVYDDGRHLICIPSKHGGVWHCEATPDTMRYWLWSDSKRISPEVVCSSGET